MLRRGPWLPALLRRRLADDRSGGTTGAAGGKLLALGCGELIEVMPARAYSGSALHPEVRIRRRDVAQTTQ